VPTTNAPRQHRGNRLLGAVPRDEYQRLRQTLETVHLTAGQILAEQREHISHVYFPWDAVVSLRIIMRDGASAEAAMVGNEGMVGLPLLLDDGMTPVRVVAAIGGAAERLEAAAFEREVDQLGTFRNLLRRYAQTFLNQLAQLSGCNRLHPVDRRAARWLLMTQDRTGRDRFDLTHELLAEDLGVRRVTVTLALGALQQRGLVGSSRKSIAILDRPGLEAAACECYELIRREYDHLLDGPGGSAG
jgi:CRP-like cAMP-binding protein